MNHKSVTVTLLILSIIAIPLGYLVMHPELFGMCQADRFGCINQNIQFGIGHPLYWSIRWLPFLFLALVFVKREVFDIWWRVILPIAILGLILIMVSPPLPEFMTPDRTQATELVSRLIVIVSILVIGWKYWRLSRINQTKI